MLVGLSSLCIDWCRELLEGASPRGLVPWYDVFLEELVDLTEQQRKASSKEDDVVSRLQGALGLKAVTSLPVCWDANIIFAS
jgi:hypothetical protein